jgi:hypothetical protein
MTQDDEQLRLLSIFHYVLGGIAGLFAMFPLLHLMFGLFIIVSGENFDDGKGPPPAFVGWMFVSFAAVFITLGLTFAAFVLAAGRFLAQRRNYTFCLVMAGVECIFMPLGTVLGVFTIIILMRESVKRQFTVRVT